ncbi:linear amide C-N hydrolase [Rhizobium leguminosarum]|uniref:linear amide C-N hydrolase n=1 Tax=Rhizobium leguminosarum TaxID=384 RepID=UPI001031E013|nr:linear amide C-N hydrolase [Rhizobium leguminosarum]TAY15965.1 linear amide C-N hydrolase [Rhizobium leguminosarum]
MTIARRMLPLTAALVAILAPPFSAAFACTRVLWNENKLGVFVGRTMDFPVSTEPVITVLPRGIAHDGGTFAGQRIESSNPARWVSKYGSIVTSVYGAGTADGVNEKGVAMHLLYFIPTDFGVRDVKKPGLQAALWGQFVLDNAASVEESLALLDSIQPLMVDHEGIKATVHLAIEDATGDSAIIEYIPGGKKTIYHSRDYRIMTNDPSFDQQLANRAKYNFDNATRQTPIPGNTDAKDRFIRADYYRQWLPEPKNTREAVAAILAIARNVSVPFGAPNREPGSLYNTEYRTAIDLTNRTYYFEFTTAPNVIWTTLSNFDLSEGRPVQVLDPDDINLTGDVTSKFTPDKIGF